MSQILATHLSVRIIWLLLLSVQFKEEKLYELARCFELVGAYSFSTSFQNLLGGKLKNEIPSGNFLSMAFNFLSVIFSCSSQRTFCSQRKQLTHVCTNQISKDYPVQGNGKSHSNETLRRNFILTVLVSTSVFPSLPSYGKTKSKNPFDEKRLLEQNKRIQKENNAPEEFPNFVREGFEVKVVTSDSYVKSDSGLIYRDYEVGKGDCPKDGQQVTFHYIGYNESGRRIDSTYLQNSPARIRLGTKALVPGFEEGIRDMRPGGKRRIIIPPELGPPVGPSTFFSSKQFEVFDVELLSIQNCERRTIAFYSDVVCN